jgi:phosphoserine phosphatase
MSQLVATLIANPAHPALSDALLARAAQALPSRVSLDILAPGIAADLVFAHGGAVEHAALADGVRAGLGGAPIDVIVQPVAGRRKRLLLADMDSTMIGQECIDELADCVGLKAEVAAVTERAMAGDIAFEPALRERVDLLRGLSASVVDRIVAERVTLTPGGRTLVRVMRAHGAYTALVSGGFTLFTGPIAERIGFDEHRSNRLIIENNAFTGAVEEPILGRQAKRAALIELRDRFGLTRHETLAVGDGANDLAMLREASLGVAFRAKPAVAAAADARLDHADLTALLYAQGYRGEECEE